MAKWTQEELDDLYRFYPSEGVEGIISRGNKRTRTTIIKKTSVLGIRLEYKFNDNFLKFEEFANEEIMAGAPKENLKYV